MGVCFDLEQKQRRKRERRRRFGLWTRKDYEEMKPVKVMEAHFDNVG